MNPELLLAHFKRISEAPEAIPRLRRFILDVAVRGKLVEQNPNDEPASKLLQRIQSEKARLLKAREIKKEKPFSLIERDEEPFSAPPGWEWTRIRQVTSNRGQATPKKDFTYIDVTAINKEVGCVAGAKVVTPADAPSRARKLVQTGDVLYSCVRPYLLNIAVIESDITPAPIASTAFVVLNGFGLVLSKYLWIALRSPFMVECVEAKMRGQAYPAINDSDFDNLPFPLPPLAEQHRIVAKVNELMALCDRLEITERERETRRDRLTSASHHHLNNGANAEALRNYVRFYLGHIPQLTISAAQVPALRQTILNLAVRGQLVHQDATDEPASLLLERLDKEIRAYTCEQKIAQPIPDPIREEDVPHPAPRGWIWTRLCSIFKVITDGDHQPPPKEQEGVAFLTIGNVTTGSLDFSNCRFVSPSYLESVAEYRKPSYGDILYTVVGATYGRPVLVGDKRPFCVQRHIAILKPTSEVDTKFLRLLLASPLVYDQATRSATGAAQPTIALKPLRNFLVPVPPSAEQHRIVAKVAELMALCDRLEVQLTTTQAASGHLLESVLYHALTDAR